MSKEISGFLDSDKKSVSPECASTQNDVLNKPPC